MTSLFLYRVIDYHIWWWESY